jgi:uncharacterized spore protein YtfJ
MFEFKSIEENVGSMMEKLEKFLVNRTVVGEKIEIGNVTIIPFLSVGFGTGVGLGEGGAGESKGNGGGGGIGGSIKPIAVLVIKDGNAEMLPIKKSSGLEALVAMVPDILEKVNVEKKTEEKQGCCEDKQDA